MTYFSDFLQHWYSWLIAAAIVIGAIIVGRIVHWIIFYVLKRIARNPNRVMEVSLVEHGKKPAKWILPFLAVL
ncbi:MAG: hypothetical protein ABI164_02225, partial [Acidobacteriaceae bacterium]